MPEPVCARVYRLATSMASASAFRMASASAFLRGPLQGATRASSCRSDHSIGYVPALLLVLVRRKYMRDGMLAAVKFRQDLCGSWPFPSLGDLALTPRTRRAHTLQQLRVSKGSGSTVVPLLSLREAPYATGFATTNDWYVITRVNVNAKAQQKGDIK